MIKITDNTYCLGVWFGINPLTDSLFSMWATREADQATGPWELRLVVTGAPEGARSLSKLVVLESYDEPSVVQLCRASVDMMKLRDGEEFLLRACGMDAVVAALAVVESQYLAVEYMTGGNDGTIN